MRIESYGFGEIVIDGRRYVSDVIVFPDGVKGGWWRREGHRVCLADLEDAVREKPGVLVLGTGYSGLMRVPSDVRERLVSGGIEVIVELTGEACKRYNRLVESGRRVVAALHLTC